jgi:hypothetical protein
VQTGVGPQGLVTIFIIFPSTRKKKKNRNKPLDIIYHLYLSAFFISAGVPKGEFPEILIAKCRSRFYCTLFLCWGGRAGGKGIGDKEVGLWHTLR